MINEATVRSFLTVSRVRSITEAAKRLYLSQQAVSKHIAKLEEDLGCPLFQRERGALRLSQFGEIYYSAFSQMENALHSACSQANHLMGSVENTLIIGHLDLLDMMKYFKGMCQDFQTQNIDIDLSYRSAPDWNTLEWLLNDKVDVSFTFQQELVGYENSLDSIAIESLQEMLVVSSAYPGAKNSQSYLDFLEEPVFYTPSDDAARQHMAARMRCIGFSSDHLVEVDNILTACSCAELGKGVMFLTESCHLLDRPDFCTFPTNQRAVLVLAYRKNSQKRTVRRFADFVRQSVEQRKLDARSTGDIWR